MRLECYHGTSRPNANCIKGEGFKASIGDAQWFGDGVYAFIDGLKDPQRAAKAWAEVQSWDNRRRQYTYQYASVLHFHVEVDKDDVLDLNTKEGVELLEYIKCKANEKLKWKGRLKDSIQGTLINFGMDELDLSIKVVTGNVYIQFTKEDRKFNFYFHSPNCTMACIKEETFKPCELEEVANWEIDN